MPSVAQESPTAQSSRKRRRDDNDHQMAPPHSAANTPRGIFHQSDRAHQSSTLVNRKIIPLPPGKRQRTTVDIEIEADGEPMQRSRSNSPFQRHRHLEHRDHQQTRDASRTEDTRSPSTLGNPTTPAPFMSRCHICSRKPTRKSDLDSFADCQGCGQRTCYVCIRECLGWDGAGPSSYAYSPTIQTHPHPHPQPRPQAQPHNPHPAVSEGPNSARALPSPTAATTTTTSTPIGLSAEEAGETSFTMLDADDEDYQQEAQHEQGWTRGGGHRRVVCSRCCVERGQDGEVACLGCLPFVEG
ncbi:uncharacterized protein B0H64DRAFT_15981 [Chaetomium fimeti]|uniref:Uncharacterized protein n=1 Tax=Chaetomium fimeti TaxID=1854472 RepID=A0AAE0LWP7_9PEZI|nr:hypothetical protein B0H64DRAFT_15981 [Chaetomium fimeti]